MAFYELSDLGDTPLINGITLKAIYGENLSASFLELPSFSRVPPHHHSNEQIGIVLQGEIEYTIGGETQVCHEGMAFVIPPNVCHSLVVVSERPAKLVDVFTPIRKASEHVYAS
ncbi:cupin domain-containing protein [candidate division KSB3 bacterium]|uniref:Cupin domain-containing protein n=1 Tax=candidate division KSB3 bacterium TaxID=2044937 RepID=A0A9D5Q4S8_9BACT|nr:cupin domain-containing protein [candidate division KSB3 bacterium]MBD3323502.1 cupin domain-containing protein [candidate division KSB3 bacterium]